MISNASRLGDFGVRGLAPPAERLKAYQEQSKGLSRRLQARFWLEVLERDSQVKKLVQADCHPELTTIRRSSRWKQGKRK
jgi:hypothetical protein